MGYSKNRDRTKRPTKEESMVLSSTFLLNRDIIDRDRDHERFSKISYKSNKSDYMKSIYVYTQPDIIRLGHTFRGEKLSYDISVEWVECNFGGYRPYFNCPAKDCGERVEKLYLPPRSKHFACRECHEITYYRSNISGKPCYIAMYKKRKIAEKLEVENPDIQVGASAPQKPKNMHQETYHRLVKKWRKWDIKHKTAAERKGLKKLKRLQEKNDLDKS